MSMLFITKAVGVIIIIYSLLMVGLSFYGLYYLNVESKEVFNIDEFTKSVQDELNSASVLLKDISVSVRNLPDVVVETNNFLDKSSESMNVITDTLYKINDVFIVLSPGNNYFKIQGDKFNEWSKSFSEFGDSLGNFVSRSEVIASDLEDSSKNLKDMSKEFGLLIDEKLLILFNIVNLLLAWLLGFHLLLLGVGYALIRLATAQEKGLDLTDLVQTKEGRVK